jgi:hypothetical protein
MFFYNYKSGFDKRKGSRKCHKQLIIGNKTDDGRYMATGLSVWP